MNWYPLLINSGADADAVTTASSDNSAAIAVLQSDLADSQQDLVAAVQQIADLQASDAFTLTAEDERLLRNDYAILPLLSTDHETELAGYGEQVSARLHSGFVNRPTGIKKVGSKLLIFHYYQKPLLLNVDGMTVDRQVPVTYQNPTATATGVAYSYGGAIDLANNRIAVCSWARHIVRVYALDTGDYLYTIGVPSGAGHLSYGKLYYASQAVFHPVTGNLIVVSYYGYGLDGEGGNCTNHGHISEFDANTGVLIATRQGFKGSGTPAGGYIYRPIDGFITDDGMMWVSVYGRNMLAKLDTNALTSEGYWPVVDYIAAPPGESITNPWGICECSDGDIALVCVGPKALIKINPVTKLVTAKLSLTGAGLTGDPRRVVELEPDVFAISDWAGAQVYVVPISGEVAAQYDSKSLSAGWEHEATDVGFDTDTGVMVKPWSAMGNPFPNSVKQTMRKVVN